MAASQKQSTSMLVATCAFGGPDGANWVTVIPEVNLPVVSTSTDASVNPKMCGAATAITAHTSCTGGSGRVTYSASAGSSSTEPRVPSDASRARTGLVASAWCVTSSPII